MGKSMFLDAALIFEKERRLIELPDTGYGVFVGDTHGDLEATQSVLDNYLGKEEYTLVFLGDYVDRGEFSEENIKLLLKAKVENPRRVYLLMGNHEGMRTVSFSPSEFWDSLKKGERMDYENVLSKLPYAASGNGFIALHGAPPDMSRQRLRNVSPLFKTLDYDYIWSGSDPWLQITWGDLCESEARQVYTPEGDPRRCYGTHYFTKVMDDLGKKVLIRSHQPDAPQIMLNNRCLTLMTSHACSARRTIAVADLGKETASVDDLEIRVV